MIVAVTSVREGTRDDPSLAAQAIKTTTTSRTVLFLRIRDSTDRPPRPCPFPAAAFLPPAELKRDWFEAPFGCGAAQLYSNGE